MSAQAQDILRSLAQDVDVIPPRFQDWWRNYLKKHAAYYLEVLSCLEARDAGATILEIGSMPGQFTVLLKRLGYDVQGVDIDPSRIAPFWAKHEIPVAKVDVEQERLPFPDDRFAIVLFTEILEHLRMNPLHALAEVHRVLRPGGKIIVSTPNITPMNRLEFLLGGSYQGNPVEEFGKLEKIGHMGHIRLYSLSEVRGLLEHAGFTVRSCTYKGHVVLRGWKEKLLGLLYPNKEQLRRFVFVVATKG